MTYVPLKIWCERPIRLEVRICWNRASAAKAPESVAAGPARYPATPLPTAVTAPGSRPVAELTHWPNALVAGWPG